ncbi:class I SAM-dependent methyltransferase [Pleionea mediterranea]|uniref:Methyltransferase family protein n=1 Tax=Pleionea mediterranea TaxID=523701 RepID=A0A316FHT5_9GAMM|nr:class I SAM-dependent methyltransferase [Pleionea mediterranea]PWK48478.1 methyltransferase family protein [Pleionea mediterranea]
MVSQNIEHWSGYWSQGNITSLPVGFRDNYDREIKHFWFEQFKQLPESAVILDVCTGNGAIALLAAEFSDIHQKNFSIIAVDAASIDIAAIKARYPQLEPYLNQIQFKPSTRIEELSFDDDSFDLICSQYGIEYCNLGVVGVKLSKLLKSKGTVAIVSHTSDARILEVTTNDYKLLEPISFFSRIRKLVRNDASQKELQPLMKQTFDELDRSLLTKASPMLKLLLESCKFVISAEPTVFMQNKHRLFDFFQALQNGKARMLDLVNVHKMMKDNPVWYKKIENNGVELIEKGNLIYNNSHTAGNYFIYRKV